MTEPTTTTEKKLTICEAFARQEGFYIPDSRAARNHNPGNINWGSFAIKHGATGIERVPIDPKTKKLVETPRFASFPKDQIGFNAMSSLLMAIYIGLTLQKAVYKWAPPLDGNDSEQYVKDVCELTGLTPTTILTNALLVAPTL